MISSIRAEKAALAGVGFACDPYDADFTDKVFEYYTSLVASTLEKECDAELDKVLSEYRAGVEIIKKEVYNEN